MYIFFFLYLAANKADYNGRLKGNRTWPIEWHQHQWPSVTLNVTQLFESLLTPTRGTGQPVSQSLVKAITTRHLMSTLTCTMTS